MPETRRCRDMLRVRHRSRLPLGRVGASPANALFRRQGLAEPRVGAAGTADGTRGGLASPLFPVRTPRAPSPAGFLGYRLVAREADGCGDPRDPGAGLSAR